MPATTHADRVERDRALAITCPACDAPPKRYCRKWLVTKSRWEPYRPRHLHKVRIDAGRAAAQRKIVFNSGTERFEDEVTGRPIDRLRAALDEAHQLMTKHLHCPKLFGGKEHSVIEQDVAKALVAAFYKGKNSR